MAIVEGTHRMGPDTGRLLVTTSRTGLGSRAGHDLTIEATTWTGEACVGPEPTVSWVTVDVNADSLRVRGGSGGIKPLSDSDCAEIARIIREQVLKSSTYPLISFRSTNVVGGSEL